MYAPPPEVTALFRGAHEAFIANRDALCLQLRADGRADEARAVKALRKPTVPAWVLNQLAARDPAAIEALLDAGAELRAAQRAALSKGDPERLRVASARRRQLVRTLRAAAADVLTGSGREPGPHLDHIAAALDAAAVDPEAGDRLRAGTLERPPKPAPGLGDVAGLTALSGGKDQVAGPPPDGSGSRTAKPSPADQELASSELRDIKRRRDAELRRAKRERATADDLARQVATAEARLERLRERSHDAEQLAKAAELDARRASRDVERAEKRTSEPGRVEDPGGP